jgi:hypothetical protein
LPRIEGPVGILFAAYAPKRVAGISKQVSKKSCAPSSVNLVYV